MLSEYAKNVINQIAIDKTFIEKSEVLFYQDEIEEQIERIASEIYKKWELKGKEIVFIGILNGSFRFLADLLTVIQTNHELRVPAIYIDFLKASSYGNSKTSSMQISISYDIWSDINDKVVILVDDILDTGNTLNHIKNRLLLMNPYIVEICVLLNKPSRRIIDIKPDYEGFTIPDYFVFGYGLDYEGKYRNLLTINYFLKEK